MICHVCQAENDDSAVFCESCGAELSKVTVQTRHENNTAGETDGMALASLILGIVGITICPTFIPSVLAIIFSIISKRKSGSNGISTAGLVLGIVPVALSIIGVILYVIYLVVLILGVSAIGLMSY